MEYNKALHLSGEDENVIESLVKNIAREYKSRIDNFSAEVIVSNLELLLNYSNRFYNRQFATRKMANSDMLSRFEDLLSKHLEHKAISGLITVLELAASLNVSPGYLSDMLRTVTGQNTQQHIQDRLVEKAKELLTTTGLSVSEVAAALGFEFSQSFNKLFKNKTNLTPKAFRQSFN